MTSPINSVTTDDGRFYTLPTTGEQFPSVTTIISAGVPAGNALKYWAPKKVAEYAVENYMMIAALAERSRGI